MKNLFYHPLTAILITALVIYFIISLRSNLKKLEISRQNLSNIQQDVTQLSKEVESQKQTLHEAQQPLAQEKLARNELLLKKSGEYVIDLPDIVLKDIKLEPSPSPRPIKKWMELIKNKFAN
jgi:cell division protein FtsB